MSEQLKRGDVVQHKAAPGMEMVVTAIEPGCEQLYCCWFNEVTGEFRQDKFYLEELVIEEEE